MSVTSTAKMCEPGSQGAGQQEVPLTGEQVGCRSREVPELPVDEEPHRRDITHRDARHLGLPADGPGEFGPLADRRVHLGRSGRVGA